VRLRYRDYTDVLSHTFGEPYLVNLRSSLPVPACNLSCMTSYI
jgi:hypothetical protein